MPVKQPPKKKQQTEDVPESVQEDGQALVDEAIEKSEKLAESQLEMARLFTAHGKHDVARRRLQDVIENYARSDAAKEAKKMLRSI